MGQAGNIVILAHTVFDENWSFADGCLTDRLPNAPNANAGQTIVADGIRLGQAIYWLKTNYPTALRKNSECSLVQQSKAVILWIDSILSYINLLG